MTPRRIGTKFLLLLLVPVIAATVLASLFFGYQTFAHMEEELTVKRETMASVHGAALASPMWNFDRAGMERILATLALDPDVTAALIHDEDGNRIVATGSVTGVPLEPDLAVREMIIHRTGGKAMHLGELEIRFTRSRVEAVMTQAVARDSLLLVLLVVVLVASAAVANRILVGRPLDRLLRAIERTERDGTRQPVSWRGQDEMGRVITAYNRMQEKMAADEAALMRAAEEWTRAMDSFEDAIYLLDTERRLVRANKTFYAITRSTPETAVGRPIVELIHPEGEEEPCPVCRAQEEKRDSVIIMEPDNPDNPTGRPIEVMVQIIRDKAGVPTGILMSIHDLTAARESEEELRNTLDELMRSNAELERFAYVASHDLQEPVRSVTTYAQLLAKRYGERLDDDGRDYLEFVAAGAKRMGALVRDLLTYSRVSSRGEAFLAVDLEEVLAAAEANLQAAIQESSTRLTHSPLPTVAGDAVQLTELLQNLISNAIKFRRPDSPPDIAIGAEDRDGAWEISVSDNGIGIEEAYLEQIFVIFKRLHTIDAYPGTGIGLAVCKRIVERHGGAILAESRLGHGTTFRFTLPARDKVTAEGETDAAA